MPKGKPHPRMSSSDDDEDDTTPLYELKGVQAAKTAKTAAAAFKEKAAADKKAAAELRKQSRQQPVGHVHSWPLALTAHHRQP